MVNILLRKSHTASGKRYENDETNFIKNNNKKNAKKHIHENNNNILYTELTPLTRDVK